MGMTNANTLLKRADELLASLGNFPEASAKIDPWRKDLLDWKEANPTDSVRAVRAHVDGEDPRLAPHKSRLAGLLRLEAGLASSVAELSRAQADVAGVLSVSGWLSGVVDCASASTSYALRVVIQARQMEERYAGWLQKKSAP